MTAVSSGCNIRAGHSRARSIHNVPASPGTPGKAAATAVPARRSVGDNTGCPLPTGFSARPRIF